MTEKAELRLKNNKKSATAAQSRLNKENKNKILQ